VVADLHLAPTEESARNLYREGIARDAVVVTGNTAVDSLLHVLNGHGHGQGGQNGNGHPANGRASEARLVDPFSVDGVNGNGRDRKFLVAPPAHVLITLHRRESWMDADTNGQTTLDTILGAIRSVAQQRTDVQWSYPVHPNPRVREPAERVLGDCPNVRLLPPQPYLEFVHLMASASLILTDSGGIQEEAPSLGIPVLVARDVTERPEGVAAGCNRLVGTNPDSIERELLRALSAVTVPRGPLPRPNPYGDGQASARIRQAILHRLVEGTRPEPFVPEFALATATN
jgi:UDP-N-acetylglucosamine 2-epimerase (non-hydrolysing)